MGAKKRIDVKVNYVVKDFNNNVYLEKSEEVLVNSQRVLRRDFDVSKLPPGKYVIGATMDYPGGIASTSSGFTIINTSSPSYFGEAVYYIAIILVLSAIIFLVYLINSSIKNKRKTQKEKVHRKR